MEETLQGTIGYIFSLVGFLATIGVIVGIPLGIVLLIVGLNKTDKKAKKQYITWAIVLMVLPPLLIIGTLIAFAMTATLMGGPVGV